MIFSFIAATLVFISFENLRFSVEGTSAEAILYPGAQTKGIHLRYTDTTNWADLYKILKEEGFYSVGKLCVTGVFILYEEPFYELSKIDGYDIISGNYRCKMIPSTVKSIQPIGSTSNYERPSITFFEQRFFAAIAYATEVNQGSSFFNKMNRVGSIIIIGSTPWSVETTIGPKLCFVPETNPEGRQSICLIEQLTFLIMLMDTNVVEITRTTMGCEGVEEHNIFQIQDCILFGKSLKENAKPTEEPDTDAEDMRLAGRDGGLGNNFCTDDEKKKLVFKLYKAAITGTLDTDVVVELSSLGKNVWRVEMLDWIFKIVSLTISPLIIPPSFFARTREIFIQKLSKIWGNQTLDESDLPWSVLDYDYIMRYMETCTQLIDEKIPFDPIQKTITKIWLNMDTAKDLEGHANPEFARRPQLDIITEMVWIAGHMVGHLCHDKFLKNSPFWALYYNLFYHMYMVPVIPEWTKPTEGLNLIFGGLNHIVEYKKFAIIASEAVKNIPLELMQRPVEVTSAISNSSKPAHGNGR